jgi:hypothetical protein
MGGGETVVLGLGSAGGGAVETRIGEERKDGIGE